MVCGWDPVPIAFSLKSLHSSWSCECLGHVLIEIYQNFRNSSIYDLEYTEYRIPTIYHRMNKELPELASVEFPKPILADDSD